MPDSPDAGFLEGWSDAALLQMSGGQVRVCILLRITTSPVIRIASCVGELAIPMDLIETTDGAIYSGWGEMLDVSRFNQLINGLAERIELSVSAVMATGELAALASSSAADIRGAIVNIGFCVLGADWEIVSPVAWMWDGIAQSLRVDRAPASADAPGVIQKITLPVWSALSGRKRPSPAYFTDPDQRRRSADDRFCDRVKTYETGTTRVWPE